MDTYPEPVDQDITTPDVTTTIDQSDQNQANTPVSQPSNFQPSQNRQGLLKIIIGLAIVLCGVALTIWYGYTVWYPQYIVKQFTSQHLQLLRQKEYAAAYEQTTSGFKENNTQEQYQNYADNQGLSSSDIPFKITVARPFINERNLTKHAEVLFELKGDTGQVQAVRMMLIKELGDYKVRLIELPGETNVGSWIGARYDYEQLAEDATQPTEEEEVAPTQMPTIASDVRLNGQPSPQPQTDTFERDWRVTTTLSQINPSTWQVVNDSRVTVSAQAAAEQHFGFVRFADVTSLLKAIEQLHPIFRAIETPQSYASWLQRVGVVNVKDFSLETGTVDVRANGTNAIAKVQFKLKDFRTTDGSTMPDEKRVYVGLVGTLDPQGFIRWQDWHVISMFTEEYLLQNPAFFPF